MRFEVTYWYIGDGQFMQGHGPDTSRVYADRGRLAEVNATANRSVVA